MENQTVRPDTPFVIHFVDVARMGSELRPVCGAWGEEVTWTTVPAAMTCLACASLVARRPRGPAPGSARRGVPVAGKDRP